MKKKLSQMNDDDAFKLFNIHSDFGHFEFPFYKAHHDNGWRTTNSFSCHILEANKEKLFELFDITEEFYSEIENPLVVVSRDATFADGKFIKDATTIKIKQVLKKEYGYKNCELKRFKYKNVFEEKGIVFTYHKKPKYIKQ